jgi:hypothetical protein
MLKFTCLCFAAALPLPCLCFAFALLGFLTALNCFANFQYAATLPLLCHYFAIFGKEPLLPLSNTSSKTHQKNGLPPFGGYDSSPSSFTILLFVFSRILISFRSLRCVQSLMHRSEYEIFAFSSQIYICAERD